MLPKDVLESIPQEIEMSPPTLCAWLTSQVGLSFPAVFRYISYFKQILELSYAIAEIYDLRSGKDTDGAKAHLRHIGPNELIYIANQLYVLDSYGVKGGLLECGVSHGYSTCVLSHACGRLGRTLYAADSFQGLPPTRPDQNFFKEGDYAALLETVQQNIAFLGHEASVKYIKGYYNESLKDFTETICLLWLDVDLFESAQDVMGHVFGALDQRGVIYTHEFTDFFNNIHPREKKTPPNAIYDALEAHSVPFQSACLMRYFGVIGFEETLQFNTYEIVPHLIDTLLQSDTRWRKYAELSACKTVRLAFAGKNILQKFIPIKNK